MSSVWGMILQWYSTIKVSIELPAAIRHRRHMTEKLLKATLNPDKQQQPQKKKTIVSWLSACALLYLMPFYNIGIKHDFPFINIRKVPREVLKTEGGCALGFQHLPRDLANVNEWQNYVWSLLLHKFKETQRKLRKCLRTLFYSLTTIFLRTNAFYKYPQFGPWPGTFSHDDLKA